MDEPKPTTYSVKAITVIAECPWCDCENDITMLDCETGGTFMSLVNGCVDPEKLHTCRQCHKPFYLSEEE